MKHTFTVPGEPVSKARPRARVIAGHASVYTPKETAAFEDRVALFAREAGVRVQPGPLAVTIRFSFAWPRSKWRKRSPRREAWKYNGKDIDNLAKSVLDGLNGVAWIDDREVARLTVEKRYAEQGRPASTCVEIKNL